MKMSRSPQQRVQGKWPPGSTLAYPSHGTVQVWLLLLWPRPAAAAKPKFCQLSSGELSQWRAADTWPSPARPAPAPAQSQHGENMDQVKHKSIHLKCAQCPHYLATSKKRGKGVSRCLECTADWLWRPHCQLRVSTAGIGHGCQDANTQMCLPL